MKIQTADPNAPKAKELVERVLELVASKETTGHRLIGSITDYESARYNGKAKVLDVRYPPCVITDSIGRKFRGIEFRLQPVGTKRRFWSTAFPDPEHPITSELEDQ